MKAAACVAVVGVLTVLLGSASMSGAAAIPKVPDIPQSYLFTPGGSTSPLHAGVAYRASLFPLAIRVTPPSPNWLGAQWRSGTDYFRGGGPPHYGWLHFGRGTPTGVPQGMISFMAAYAPTPSAAATVNVLRTRGHGATYEPTTPTTVAGFSGLQFDGKIVGAKNYDHIGHFFVPYSAKSSAAKYYPDEYGVYGDVFRVIVLNVRGKTVIVYIENVGLPIDQFPVFLTKAEQLLSGVTFPR
jgi:hypothetical protein